MPAVAVRRWSRERRQRAPRRSRRRDRGEGAPRSLATTSPRPKLPINLTSPELVFKLASEEFILGLARKELILCLALEEPVQVLPCEQGVLAVLALEEPKGLLVGEFAPHGGLGEGTRRTGRRREGARGLGCRRQGARGARVAPREPATECTVSPIELGNLGGYLHLEREGEGGGCGRRSEQEREYGGETHGERRSLMRVCLQAIERRS